MTDLLVFGGYLIIVLLIGKFTGKRIHSADDFHLCGRNLGRLPAALSQAATEFSGSGLIGGAGLAYAIGLSAICQNRISMPHQLAVWAYWCIFFWLCTPTPLIRWRYSVDLLQKIQK